MAEVSKTAKASMQAGVQVKEVKVTPPEEMVRIIILNTEQNVFTGNMDYLRALIAAYKAQANELKQVSEERAQLFLDNQELTTANTWINASNAENAKFIEKLKTDLQVATDEVTRLSGAFETATAALQKFSDAAAVIAPLVEETDVSEPGLTPATQGTDSIEQ